MEFPKPHREENLELIEEIREEQGICMLKGHGECFKESDGDDIHHIKSRGSGGETKRGNLIRLCRRHHQIAHNGKIPKSTLYKILETFYE
jgi:5-methylcytosine-specific restriction endonuclease McrA